MRPGVLSDYVTSLNEVRDLVRNSDASEWHKIEEGEGPTYRSWFNYSGGSAGGAWRLREDSHPIALVYEPDVDLTIAYGMQFNQRGPGSEPTFDWADTFSDTSTEVYIADIFWRGSLIDRVHYVAVDGHRAYLPIGRGHQGLQITTWDRDVAQLLHDIKGGFGSFKTFFDQVPFNVT